MKLLLFCAFIFYYIMSSRSRLIEKTTSRPKNEEPYVYLKDMSNSGEEMDNPEIIHFYKRKVRTPKEEEKNETQNITRKNNVSQAKLKPALVKKPIPKYNDVDSDEDYQSKQIKTRLPSKVDSFDLEDEDFNLDDYDFDVHHDEFVGRGKPQEPRKEYKQATEDKKSTSAQKTKRNLGINKERNFIDQKPLLKMASKAAQKMTYLDYDDYLPRKKINLARRKASDGDYDSSHELESSSEYPRFVRNERSPWNAPFFDKLGEKGTATKFLSFLPMFPQIPGKNNN